MESYFGPALTKIFVWVSVPGLIVLMITFIWYLGAQGYQAIWPKSTQIHSSNDQVPIQKPGEMAIKAGPVFHVRGGDPLQAYVVFWNIGSAPVRVISWKMGMSILTAEIGDKASTYSDLGQMTTEPGTPTFDSAQLLQRYRVLHSLTADEITNLEQSKKRVYVFGIITYETNDGRRRQSGFCHMYSGSEHAIRESDGAKMYVPSQIKYCPDSSLNFRE